MSTPARREFIPELRNHIIMSVPADATAVSAAIDKWRDGGDAETALEYGVFSVCDQIAADLDKTTD